MVNVLESNKEDRLTLAERSLLRSPEGGIMYPDGKVEPIAKDSNPLNRKIGEGARKESDPNGISAHTPGAKLDAGKAPVSRGVLQYFPRALKAVSMVSLVGANKYAWKGWEEVPDGINRYGDALGRHLLAEVVEGPIDADTKQLHASQVAWNALARLELILRDIESKA